MIQGFKAVVSDDDPNTIIVDLDHGPHTADWVFEMSKEQADELGQLLYYLVHGHFPA